jgi:hypothetical protein
VWRRKDMVMMMRTMMSLEGGLPVQVAGGDRRGAVVIKLGWRTEVTWRIGEWRG